MGTRSFDRSIDAVSGVPRTPTQRPTPWRKYQPWLIALLFAVPLATLTGMCFLPKSSGLGMRRASEEELRQVLEDPESTPQQREAAIEQQFAVATRAIEDMDAEIEAGGAAAEHAKIYKQFLREQLGD